MSSYPDSGRYGNDRYGNDRYGSGIRKSDPLQLGHVRIPYTSRPERPGDSFPVSSPSPYATAPRLFSPSFREINELGRNEKDIARRERLLKRGEIIDEQDTDTRTIAEKMIAVAKWMNYQKTPTGGFVKLPVGFKGKPMEYLDDYVERIFRAYNTNDEFTIFINMQAPGPLDKLLIKDDGTPTDIAKQIINNLVTSVEVKERLDRIESAAAKGGRRRTHRRHPKKRRTHRNKRK